MSASDSPAPGIFVGVETVSDSHAVAMIVWGVVLLRGLEVMGAVLPRLLALVIYVTISAPGQQPCGFCGPLTAPTRMVT